jgi:hypothetical protein
MKGKTILVEQLGASSSAYGLADLRDLYGKLMPGLVAKRKVVRDDDFRGLERAYPFIEQLGVASGKWGPRDGVRALGPMLAGLVAKRSVARETGLDLRARAYALIEERALQLELDPQRKAVLLAFLYSVARRLPGR